MRPAGREPVERASTSTSCATCGLTREAIAKRVADGRLHPLYRGVYAVGHPTPLARWLLPGRRQGLRPGRRAQPLRGRLPLVPAQVGLPRPRGHRAERAQARGHPHPPERHIERTFHNGIPVTPPLRTLIDLSSMLPYNTAAQSGQRSPQPAARQAARTRHRATTAAHATQSESSPQPRPHATNSKTSSTPSSTTSRSRRSTSRCSATSPTSSGPTTASSSKPTAARSTTNCSPEPTTTPASASWKPNGYHVLRVTWRQATTQPRRSSKPASGVL